MSCYVHLRRLLSTRVARRAGLLWAVALLAAGTLWTPTARAEGPRVLAPVAGVANNSVGVNLVRWMDAWYLKAVAELVNSGGGDWGYVTVVLIDDDRSNPMRMQIFLDQCAALHLTPIIRVGSTFSEWVEVWQRPLPGDPQRWLQFFESMKWPTASRYIIVGNEPNLGREWGGEVDPADYARYLSTWLDTYAAYPRYKIFNGALDASNDTHPPDRMDEFEFIDGMRGAVPDIFDRLHGWSSNPYHFWWKAGERRFSYRAYEHELDVIGRDLPVIIVESALGHVDDPRQIADYYQMAFEYWLTDPRVLAATPLAWNPEENRFWLFDVAKNGNIVYTAPAFQRIKILEKPRGSPAYGAPPEAVATAPPTNPLPVGAVPPGAVAPASAFVHRLSDADLPPSMLSRSRRGELPEEAPLLKR